jgi:hypothetical protein
MSDAEMAKDLGTYGGCIGSAVQWYRKQGDLPHVSHKTKKVVSKKVFNEHLTDVVRENDYKKSESVLKAQVRTMVIDSFTGSVKDNSNVFMLPSDNFKCVEKLVSVKSNLHIHAVERDIKVWTKGLALAAEHGVKFHNCSDLDYLSVIEQKFDAMWLDYCCTWSKDVQKSLELIASRDLLNPGATVAITLMWGRELDIDSLYAKTSKTGKDKSFVARAYGLPAFIKEITGLNLESITKYSDNMHRAKCAPMYTLVFKNSEVKTSLFNELKSSSHVLA